MGSATEEKGGALRGNQTHLSSAKTELGSMTVSPSCASSSETNVFTRERSCAGRTGICVCDRILVRFSSVSVLLVTQLK